MLIRENVSMALPGGEIYFIREKDLDTQELTGYVKVGIVRENLKDGARNSNERLAEHQTGNPRELQLHHVIKTPIVEKVETKIHNHFAKIGIRGEWLRINEFEIGQIIEQAQVFADEASVAAPIFEKAEELATTPSEDEKISPTPEATDYHHLYSQSQIKLKHYETLEKEIAALLKEAIAKGENVGKVAKIQEKKITKKFDPKLFAEKFPDLFALFNEIVVGKVGGRFSPTTLKLEGYLEESVLPLTSSIIEVIESVKIGQLEKAKLHKPRLELYALSSSATWDKELATAHLKVICGTAAGIEGICTWNRAEKKTEKLNIDALKDAHPKEYEECMVQSGGGQALIVDKKMGYADE